MKSLKERLPTPFHIEYFNLQANEAGLPQSRPRVYITGIVKWVSDMAGCVQGKPPAMDKVLLHDFLSESDVKSTPASLKTNKGCKFEYCKQYAQMFKQIPKTFTQNEVSWTISQTFRFLFVAHAGSGGGINYADPNVYYAKVACVNLSRGPEKTFGPFFVMEGTPTFTTRNGTDLHVVGNCPGKVSGSLGRPLHIMERARCSGIDGNTLKCVEEKWRAHGLGNTMPVPVVGRMLCEIFAVFGKYEDRYVKIYLLALKRFNKACADRLMAYLASKPNFFFWCGPQPVRTHRQNVLRSWLEGGLLGPGLPSPFMRA